MVLKESDEISLHLNSTLNADHKCLVVVLSNVLLTKKIEFKSKYIFFMRLGVSRLTKKKNMNQLLAAEYAPVLKQIRRICIV